MKQGAVARCATVKRRLEKFLLHEDLHFGHIYPGGRKWALFRPTRLPEKTGRPTERQTKGVLGYLPSL
jgi:hypothetical protein